MLTTSPFTNTQFHCLELNHPSLIVTPNRVYSENASLATMAEQSQVLSMQMVSCEERLARAETDLRVERECRNALQLREVQLKEQITGFKVEIRDLLVDRREKEQLKQDLDAINKRYLESERTLEELGMQLSTSKLQIVEFKEKQRNMAADINQEDGSSVVTNNPSWTPDKMASQCRACNREFSMTRRKHHCRHCGMIFCNNCSDHAICLASEVAGPMGKPVRVCDTCWLQLSATT